MLNSRKIFLLVFVSLLITACGSAEPALPTPTPDLGYEVISFTNADGRKLGGRIYGEGENAVILAHMAGPSGNQRNWSFFADILAEKGYTVLTFDFRGFGTSEGQRVQEMNLTNGDAVAAVKFLQARGLEKITCIGGSMGAIACLTAGLEVEISGIISLSAPISMGSPTELTEENLPLINERKLIVGAENDGPIKQVAQTIYDNSPEPKEIKIFTGSSHGINLLRSTHKDALEQLIFDFLADM